MWALIMLLLSPEGNIEGYKVNKKLVFETQEKCVQYLEQNQSQLVTQGAYIRGNMYFNFACANTLLNKDLDKSLNN